MQAAFGVGAPGAIQIVGPQATAAESARLAAADPAIAQVSPPQPGARGLALVQAIPAADPSDAALGTAVGRLRQALPNGVLVGGAAVENHDLERALSHATPLVIGVVLGLGFLLLLVALQAPLIAAIGVVTNLLVGRASFEVRPDPPPIASKRAATGSPSSSGA